ncbi:MAG: DUF7283 family protein [Halodesulfurarchaeum sp.]
MFGVPADTAPIWVGLTVASAVMLGAVLGLTASAPDAQHAAATIEEVAAGEVPGEASVTVRADSLRIGPDRIGLRGPGGTAHAEIRYGPVTPVQLDSRLERVLEGTAPAAVFDGEAGFAAALERAQDRRPTWRSTGGSLRIRAVSYGEVNGVLVG